MNIRPHSPIPSAFPSPFDSTPHPLAEQAAREVMDEVRAYMKAHPDSELHRRGKMFGVLVYQDPHSTELGYLRAFSAMLDGSYHHPGFVPPIYEVHPEQIVGRDAADSRDKQQWLFRQYRLRNARGEEKDLLDIFRDQPPIMSIEEFFSSHRQSSATIPPSGTGECCAPKLIQYAYLHGLRPICMAEFWMGASPRDELRREGVFYPACSGKCRPILHFTLQGLSVADSRRLSADRQCAEQTEILYEDDYLVAACKPAGLLSVPGKEEGYSLQEYLSERHGAPIYPVHRLDMDTSGVIVMAKTPEVAKLLQQQFLRHDLHKMYIAELETAQPMSPAGQPLLASGIITLPLLPNPLDRPRQMVSHEHGKKALTRYCLTDLIGSHGGRIVHLFPATGRTHQLRVHCAHPEGLNTPIYGDRLYGTLTSTRLMLHAAELHFTHPITAQPINVCRPS